MLNVFNLACFRTEVHLCLHIYFVPLSVGLNSFRRIWGWGVFGRDHLTRAKHSND